MGRPREHDEQTAAELLDAAERIVEASGLAALSVRRVAEEVATTTRAVYTSFGSKDGLVAALGARAFHLLGEEVRQLPVTANPADDLVEAGVAGFRQFAMTHPAFRLAVQQTDMDAATASSFRDAADEAMTHLLSRIEALHAANQLGDRTIRDAACEFHAFCEGLAALELRGIMDQKRAESIWRDALGSLVTGFAHTTDRPEAAREPGTSPTRPMPSTRS